MSTKKKMGKKQSAQTKPPAARIGGNAKRKPAFDATAKARAAVIESIEQRVRGKASSTGKGGAAPAKPGATKRAGSTRSKKDRPMSGLDAAAKVLLEAKTPMRVKDMVDRVLAKGMWKTNGKTPSATIYAAIIREIRDKGPQARFVKTDRGLFSVRTVL